MPKSPSHHPSKHPPQTPVKWRSPRRCSNEGQIGNGNVSFQSNFLWNLFLLSASVVFPLIDWCLSFQGYCKDTILMEDSPVKWRSPRRCLNKDDGSVSFYFILLKIFLFLFHLNFGYHLIGWCLYLQGLFKDAQAMAESPLCHPVKPPQSPVKWKSPRRCSDESQKGKTPPQSPVKWRSPRRCSNESQKSNGSVSFISVISFLCFFAVSIWFLLAFLFFWWQGPYKDFQNGSMRSPKSPRKRLLDQFSQKPKWNPRGKHTYLIFFFFALLHCYFHFAILVNQSAPFFQFIWG